MAKLLKTCQSIVNQIFKKDIRLQQLKAGVDRTYCAHQIREIDKLLLQSTTMTQDICGTKLYVYMYLRLKQKVYCWCVCVFFCVCVCAGGRVCCLGYNFTPSLVPPPQPFTKHIHKMYQSLSLPLTSSLPFPLCPSIPPYISPSHANHSPNTYTNTSTHAPIHYFCFRR